MVNQEPEEKGRLISLTAGRNEEENTGIAADLQRFVGLAMSQQQEYLLQMADAMRGMQGKIEQMEKQMAYLIPVGRKKAATLNEAMAEQAQELCKRHRLAANNAGKVKKLINRDIKTAYGIGSIQDLPLSLYAECLKRVKQWEDYEKLLEIKREGR